MKHVAFLTVFASIFCARLALGEDHSADAVKTVAVLDFVNRNPADGRDWLGKGLADMVITDLSASHRLTVVDRERVQDLAREMELSAAGLVDPGTASRVGQVAKVRRVLFGTFLCRGDTVAIEALMIDVTKRQTVRIEQVEGPLGSLFDLEQRLVRSILAKLDVPMTDEELRMVKLLKTQSLPAFEHYARSLGFVDEGRFFDGLREARLARRADPAYFAAAARVAQLYYEVGEPEHAMLEYRCFVEEDRRDKLPAEVYLAMGKILEQAFADRAGAIGVLQRIVGRDPQYERPFRITDPPPPLNRLDEIGIEIGLSGPHPADAAAQSSLLSELSKELSRANASFEEHKSALQALERIARWQLETGDVYGAAQRYGQLWHFSILTAWLGVRVTLSPSPGYRRRCGRSTSRFIGGWWRKTATRRFIRRLACTSCWPRARWSDRKPSQRMDRLSGPFGWPRPTERSPRPPFRWRMTARRSRMGLRTGLRSSSSARAIRLSGLSRVKCRQKVASF